MLFCIKFWGAGKENLFNKQEFLYLMIIFFILSTLLSDSGVMM